MKQEFIRVGRIVNAHGIRGGAGAAPPVSPALLTRCKTFLYRRSAHHPPRRITSTRSWCC